jgi:HEAT repeat protein
MTAFGQLYEEVVKACSFESMSADLNRQLGESCTPDDVRVLIKRLESLKDEDLADDAGDVGDFYWRLRTSISDALAAAGQQALGPLLSALNSPNEKAAEYAARSLGLLRSKQAIAPIVSKMRHAPTNAGRFAYIGALGGIGDDCVIKELLPYLSRSNEENGGWLVRLSATALGKIGNEAVLGPLTNVLAEDSNWFARLGAAEGLGFLGNAEALPALRQALHDLDPRVAKAAQESIDLIQGSGHEKQASY